MKKEKEKIPTKWDKMTIEEIEGEIKGHKVSSLEAMMKATEALDYLRMTGRFKENKLYRKSNFEGYLMGMFNTRLNTHMENARAFGKHPAESLKYGAGLVSKIHRACGAIKEKKVLEEIVEADKKAKTPIKRSKIEAIIQKYAKPTPPATPQYKALYVAEMKAHERTKEQYQEAVQELKQARKQIEKLKATILNLKSYFVEDTPMEEMRA